MHFDASKRPLFDSGHVGYIGYGSVAERFRFPTRKWALYFYLPESDLALPRHPAISGSSWLPSILSDGRMRTAL